MKFLVFHSLYGNEDEARAVFLSVLMLNFWFFLIYLEKCQKYEISFYV